MAQTAPEAASPTRLKVPPHSIEAEQSVLGGLMLNNEAWDTIADRVQEADFYRANHRVLFRVMGELANETEPLDAVTLAEALRTRGLVEQSGGLAYLGELLEATPAASNVAAYADIVRERSILRQLIGAANDIAESAYAPEGRPSGDLLSLAEQAVFRISDERLQGAGPQRVEPLLEGAKARIEELSGHTNPITGVSTGFSDLDEKTAGFQNSDLIVIAGRPSMGKTALAVNIAERAVMHTEDGGGAVLLFSLEQSAEQLAVRLLSAVGHIDQTRMRNGQMHDDDWPRFDSALKLLRGKPLYIDDTPALSALDIQVRARRVQREAPGRRLKLIVVDYMQLMRPSEKAESRARELSEISGRLKAIAKEMGCPLVALSQLNRAPEARENKRPRMSDLRESGAIEQDADVILFIYREEVYEPETEDKFAELIIAKQRNGPTGMVKLTFIGSLTKFKPYAHDDYADTPEA